MYVRARFATCSMRLVLPRRPVRSPHAAASGVASARPGVSAAPSRAAAGPGDEPHAATRTRQYRFTTCRILATSGRQIAWMQCGIPLATGRGMSVRLALDIARAALDPDRPLVTHLVITRRCNLSCGYCFEYDKVSPPVPVDVLRERIDHLARLKSVFVTLTGGESLLHPQAAELVAYIRDKGMVPFLNTNGYLL